MIEIGTRRPERVCLQGNSVLLRPLAEDDAIALWDAGAGLPDLWQFMGNGPFAEFEAFLSHVRQQATSDDPLFFTIGDRASGRALGLASLMRIEPKHRVIEVGHILYTPLLQRTRGATEAMYLLAKYCFEDLAYRRYEWKCNAMNEPSRRSALRLGFTFEGIFRQHMIIKGQNRDTAWFSMLDGEWPERKARFERWLMPENFDENGMQAKAL